MPVMNRQWILARRPVGDIAAGDLELRETPIPEPAEGEFLARTIYLSLDPTNRIWMSDRDQYMPPVNLGEVMRGGTLGVVERSRHPGFKPGDIVSGIGGWQDYALAQMAQKLPAHRSLPLPAYMSVMGMTGATAYFGLLDIGKPQAGETLVVSAAAGAVGSIVGQIGKLKGCHVVGIAGSDEKCRHVVSDFGFDVCLNYRSASFAQELTAACPRGIDIDFENVGGSILDDILARINLNARIVLCGLIATYNAKTPVPGPYNFAQLLMKRAHLEGFIVSDYMRRMKEFWNEMSSWVESGQIKYDVTIVHGLEQAPEALKLLFTGGNTGKLLLQLSDEP
jgi:NADPH-dependent curcumin reductase CurA